MYAFDLIVYLANKMNVFEKRKSQYKLSNTVLASD